MGTAKETVGKMTGATSLQQSGKEDHAAGETENKAAQTKGHAEGMTDQIAGKKDSMMGAMTGDKKQQTSGKSLYADCMRVWFFDSLCFYRQYARGQGSSREEDELVNVRGFSFHALVISCVVFPCNFPG